METAQDQSKTKKLSVLILGISLFLSVGLNIYLLTRTYDAENTVVKRDAEVDSLSDVKASIENDYQAMTFELDQFKGKNIQLDSLLEKANGDIERQKRKLDQLIKENKDLPLIRRQMEELKAIRDQYRVQIEQLIKENKELRFENVNLTQEVSSLNQTTKQLSEKVELASTLRGESLIVKTFREKAKGKLEETEKAKRVNKIAGTFVIAENKVAKAGRREMVFRVLKPDGLVLTDPNSSGSFTREDGRNIEFTDRANIEYANDRTEVKFEWNETEELKAGLYIAEVYLDGKMMGNYKFNLK
jgi:predicted nuclease with TOPRIM domain